MKLDTIKERKGITWKVTSMNIDFQSNTVGFILHPLQCDDAQVLIQNSHYYRRILETGRSFMELGSPEREDVERLMTVDLSKSCFCVDMITPLPCAVDTFISGTFSGPLSENLQAFLFKKEDLYVVTRTLGSVDKIVGLDFSTVPRDKFRDL